MEVKNAITILIVWEILADVPRFNRRRRPGLGGIRLDPCLNRNCRHCNPNAFGWSSSKCLPTDRQWANTCRLTWLTPTNGENKFSGPHRSKGLPFSVALCS